MLGGLLGFHGVFSLFREGLCKFCGVFGFCKVDCFRGIFF